ncbi:hypothetical protein P9D56_26195 [Peribacillus simplex]|nr:hypothetical protein [Peribacillus simplex]MEC1400692.1 hypothetical protein [Peribacillus simplex]MED3986052.1 hypothetical protein [Peribacillus simplex]MED4093491.1 hypothetical protein [Peribacillus simplex]
MRLEYLDLYAKKHDAGGIAGVFSIALFFFRSSSWRPSYYGSIRTAELD